MSRSSHSKEAARNPMQAATPEEAVELLDHAFNAGDLQAVLSFYENSAVVVTEPAETISRCPLGPGPIFFTPSAHKPSRKNIPP
jgi:hypothetical protein